MDHSIALFVSYLCLAVGVLLMCALIYRMTYADDDVKVDDPYVVYEEWDGN